MRRRTAEPAAILLLALVSSGCAIFGGGQKLNYQTIKADPHRDTDRARAENERALEAIEAGDWEDAEEALQKAMIADVTYGPAHNNLGQVFYWQRKYHLAAWEFEYARKLMPERPEVYNNLGLVYEAVNKLVSAIGFYMMAYEMDPANPEFIGNLVRAKIRSGERSEETRQLLQDLLFYDDRPDWTAWAQEQLKTTHVHLLHEEDEDLIPPANSDEMSQNEVDPGIAPTVVPSAGP